ncbi:MAG: AAA family ATPase, partial [Anaerolineales bacterium]|nr:AAA family ATPase [Anaerolineales bacterium]
IENLEASFRHNLVLIGQRRMGKTSLLKQLMVRLPADYIPVYLDGQVMGLDPGMSSFFHNLATEISFALQDQGLEFEAPSLEYFEPNPGTVFEHEFLRQAIDCAQGKQLLILLDEFEELENAVRRSDLNESIFGYLRHLMQHYTELSFIFCGTHRLEDLASDYWSILFNISLYQHVGNLSREEAMRLIQEPVARYGMRYDDLALDKLWRLTSGHPYFLQLLCHSLVNRHNRIQRNYVTIADVNTAMDEILASGEAHFVYLWTESNAMERLALFALSRTMPLAGSSTPVQVIDYLTERGSMVSRREIREAMHHLSLREIIRVSDRLEATTDESYRWQLGLLGLWVEKYKSLGRVMDEVS